MRIFRQYASLVVVVGLMLGAHTAASISAAEQDGRHNWLSQQEIAGGWLMLFDGQSLFGWQQADHAKWRVANGALECQGSGPMLTTTTRWADFVLRLQFRAGRAYAGGLVLRSSGAAGNGQPQCEIAIAENVQTQWPTGSLLNRCKAQMVEHPKAADDWRELEMRLEGQRLHVKLDGRQVLDCTDVPVGCGHIGLVCREGEMALRNIKLRPLGLKSIFNGKDLTGWKVPGESKSTFSVTPEGWLNVKGGRGALESEGLYGDFVLQLDVKVNGKGLNSGVFFRSIPGQVMNGYECQIHNVFQGEDRTQPVDCGTGGIFRRQNARKVVADDFQWFTLTIHADGKHLATWVNGYQTADWTDQRLPHENPRNGCRVEPGTIQFQGHDPTTDLDFRNIRVGAVAPTREGN